MDERFSFGSEIGSAVGVLWARRRWILRTAVVAAAVAAK
jgi:uncharacterized protein involved in exopolysaccharide biosynthesis